MIGDTLKFPDANYAGYSKIYSQLERVGNSEVVNATTGTESDSTTWADAAKDLSHNTDRKTVSLTLPPVKRGGQFLLRTFGSNDGTADNNDMLIDSWTVTIDVVGGSPAFSCYPQKY